MAFIHFSEHDFTNKDVGSKALLLAQMYQKGMPVPEGAILTTMPEKEEEWSRIFSLWEKMGQPNLAIRSSALGEDSAEFSFAGQNSTYLNVHGQEEIKAAIKACFCSVDRQASRAYREYFMDGENVAKMSVVIQKMLNPKFSGVYFSKDPRGINDEDLLEVVEGLGEELVSGRKTPQRTNSKSGEGITFAEWKPHYMEEIQAAGKKGVSLVSGEVDMEWSVDEDGTFYVLQARPVTALKSLSSQQKIVDDELQRLKLNHPERPAWDGQTFAEWAGTPTQLTLSIWKEAFSPHKAFGDALERLGYLSFVDQKFCPESSILDEVYGRAYVNLSKLNVLFFGPIPYSIVPKPRPHLKFDWKKLDWPTIFRAPLAIWKMAKVGWELSANRKKWLNQCRQELLYFKNKMARPMKPDVFNSWSNDELLQRLQKEGHGFSKNYLLWPLILITLTESTIANLLSILKSVEGEEKANELIKKWMGNGLHTATSEMNLYYKKACAYKNTRSFFMSRYGHRGPGELDLSNPRWIELGDKAFVEMSEEKYQEHKDKFENKKDLVETEIGAMDTFKRSIIAQEWKLLKEMLELREQWKMELLRPYAHIRFISEEIGKRLDVNKDIHWLSLLEIEELLMGTSTLSSKEVKNLIAERKMKGQTFKQFSFPSITGLDEIERVINGEANPGDDSFEGEPISPGLVEGTVRVVSDFANLDDQDWPDDAILVAEAIDPGWTSLFARSRGIIVEKGGVLSHCGILAREMGLPAVSGINRCHQRLKDGDKVWLDGSHGRITLQ